MPRSFVEGVASWELLGLVLLGGIVSTGYRLWHGVLTRQAVLVLALTALIARRGRRPRPSPMSWMTIGSSKHR